MNYLQQEVVHTGIGVRIPEGHYGRIAPKSGWAIQRNVWINGGVIDPHYIGEVKVLMENHGLPPVQIRPGYKIAQLIIEKISTPEIIEVTSLFPKGNSEKRFGSPKFGSPYKSQTSGASSRSLFYD